MIFSRIILILISLFISFIHLVTYFMQRLLSELDENRVPIERTLFEGSSFLKSRDSTLKSEQRQELQTLLTDVTSMLDNVSCN